MSTNFKSQLELLYELQNVDLTLHDVALKLEALPNKLSESEKELNVIKSERDEYKTKLDAAEHLRRTTEMALNDAIATLVEREKKLYAIKTTKEYQAAIKEVAETKRLNKEREDTIIKAMEEIEVFKVKLSEAEGKVAEVEKKHNEVIANVEKEKNELKSLCVEDEKKKPELKSKIEIALVRKYDFVRTAHPDALAAVENGVCLGCHMNIPPQLYNELLRLNELKFCPSCRRLLYPKDLFKSADETPAAANG
ncbi:MAG: C4-type zinc ribbon domain-containing protein [Pseudomonadota bacterium]